jgi:hypothetical protein
MTKEQFLAAKRYVETVRNDCKRRYARDYLEWITSNSPRRAPPSYECSVMAAQAVRMSIDRLLST